MTHIVTRTDEARAAVRAAQRAGKRVGFVPTMGALHEGHVSLVRAAATECDYVVVSIFVNPTQFAPGEDFERYPRDLDADAALLEPCGVDLIFAPDAAEMYPPGEQTRVVPGALASRWEGEIRPGHFEGVATVVTKLLGGVPADVAFFGEKDYQQLAVVRRLVADLAIATAIVGCPIVREADGLALSSRNAYLSPDDRVRATSLSAALGVARSMAEHGERDAAVINAAMLKTLAARVDHVDYAVIVDAETLEPLAELDRPARAIVAARLGTTRLIDNCPVLAGA